MSGKELVEKYKNMDFEEVYNIAHNPDSSFDEIIAASIIVTNKEFAEGNYHTLEEAFGEKIWSSYK